MIHTVHTPVCRPHLHLGASQYNHSFGVLANEELQLKGKSLAQGHLNDIWRGWGLPVHFTIQPVLQSLLTSDWKTRWWGRGTDTINTAWPPTSSPDVHNDFSISLSSVTDWQIVMDELSQQPQWRNKILSHQYSISDNRRWNRELLHQDTQPVTSSLES